MANIRHIRPACKRIHQPSLEVGRRDDGVINKLCCMCPQLVHVREGKLDGCIDVGGINEHTAVRCLEIRHFAQLFLAGPRMLHYVAVVGYAFWCQSTALVVSAVAQTLAGGANSQPASRKSCCC